MTRALQPEIEVFLAGHGPSTSGQIAAGIRARRSAVDEQLLAGRFVEAATPDGGNPRARYWIDPAVSSRAVLPPLKGQSRAGAMLAVLSDGRKHSRDEIFAKAGRFFLTNNAATELRRQGHDIRHEYSAGHVSVYWLAPSHVAYRARAAKARSARAFEDAA